MDNTEVFMICKHCGAEINDNEKICPECGKSVEKGRKVKDVLCVVGFVFAVVVVLAVIYTVAYSFAH